MARFDRFALRPKMSILGLVAHLGSAEVETLSGFGVPGDRETCLFAGGDRFGERNGEFFVHRVVSLDFL